MSRTVRPCNWHYQDRCVSAILVLIACNLVVNKSKSSCRSYMKYCNCSAIRSYVMSPSIDCALFLVCMFLDNKEGKPSVQNCAITCMYRKGSSTQSAVASLWWPLACAIKLRSELWGEGELALIYYKNDNANGATMLTLTSTLLNSPYIAT